jgi:putative membrane protein
MNIWIALPSCAIGLAIGAAFSLLPGLHVYNVAGLIVMLLSTSKGAIPEGAIPGLMMGMVVAYAFVSTVPAIFLGAPDESAVFVVLPGLRYMMCGRGYEAVALVGVGGLLALAGMIVLAPFFLGVLHPLRQLLRPHMFWILGAVLLFLVMSEWPKGTDREKTGIGRWLGGWTNVGAGLLTMVLSSFLGIILLNTAFLPSDAGFQGLMPVFVGLFAIPMIVGNIIARIDIPRQRFARTVDLTWGTMLRGGGAGILGGLFAAAFPVVTGGIGGLLAGHATAQRDDRSFIVSQGASKVLYYVGGFLLFFLPGMAITKGGMASMTALLYSPTRPEEFLFMLGLTAGAGSAAFLISLGLSRFAAGVIARIDYHVISWVTLCFALVIVGVPFVKAGLGALVRAYAVTLVAAAIGMIPAMWGSRRLNCMAVLLVPLIIQMSGHNTAVLRMLGLTR